MRLDHIAYRVTDRHKTAKFFQDVFGYKISDEFTVQIEENQTAQCLVLSPPEKNDKLNSNSLDFNNQILNQQFHFFHKPNLGFMTTYEKTPTYEYHLAPEIFISDGSEGSVIFDWVQKRDSIGGIHHLAYQVDSVEKQIEEMKKLGYVEFLSDEPIRCDGLVQIFTKPSQLTGVIYEFIERSSQGFCKDSVKELMKSTKNI